MLFGLVVKNYVYYKGDDSRDDGKKHSDYPVRRQRPTRSKAVMVRHVVNVIGDKEADRECNYDQPRKEGKDERFPTRAQAAQGVGIVTRFHDGDHS